MPTANAGAPPVRLYNVCSPTAWPAHAFRPRHRESPAGDGRCGRLRSLPYYSRRTVDREINSRLQHASRNHRHDRHHRLRHHRAVSDHARFGLAPDQLGGGPAGNQRMESADRAAGDGDKCEGKNISGKHRPVPSMNRVSGGMCSVGCNATIPTASRANRPQLHKRAQVIARRQQQPHRQRRSRKTVNDYQNRQRRRR